jgi:hypothetical protein
MLRMKLVACGAASLPSALLRESLDIVFLDGANVWQKDIEAYFRLYFDKLPRRSRIQR